MMKVFKEDNTTCAAEKMRGAAQSFEYKSHILSKQTEYQKIDIYETDSFGRILVLDDVVQCTERDEFIYHEMMVHVPMMSSKKKPKNVLIIGGGDGGCLREVLKYESVEHVTMIEMDIEVIDESVKNLRIAGTSFLDQRVGLFIGDASEVLQDLDPMMFDVAIIDCTDAASEGAQKLFSMDFAGSISRHMKPRHSFISMMCGSPAMQDMTPARDFICEMEGQGWRSSIYTAAVPTYYGGPIAMALFSTSKLGMRKNVPPGLRHYDQFIHVGAFAIPRWIRERFL